MEKTKSDYSYKNMPIPSVRSYKLLLIEKTELVIKRMRWKGCFYNKGEETKEVPKDYSFKCLNCPPQIKKLSSLENELFNLLNIIQFRKVQGEFKRKLKEDIQLFNSESKTQTFADKTTNLYKLEKKQYKKPLKHSVTTTYERVNKKIEKQINLEGKNIVKDKTIANRILVNGHNKCFISLKDHKPNFTNNPKTRLINPAKNEIGRLKQIHP